MRNIYRLEDMSDLFMAEDLELEDLIPRFLVFMSLEANTPFTFQLKLRHHEYKIFMDSIFGSSIPLSDLVWTCKTLARITGFKIFREI